MAILDLKEKIEPFRKNATGYVKQLLSADHVVMSDGTTLQTKMDSLNSALLDKTYPINSIYMSTSNTNPKDLFGGTWVAWGTGRVPIGVNTSDGNFNAVEKTGGSKTVNSSHVHGLSNARAGVGRSSAALSSLSYVNGGNPHNVTFDREFAYAGGIQGVSKSASDTAKIYGNTDSGGSTTLSILPPYITCYMWKRIA